jgi:hypothetical protein
MPALLRPPLPPLVNQLPQPQHTCLSINFPPPHLFVNQLPPSPSLSPTHATPIPTITTTWLPSGPKHRGVLRGAHLHGLGRVLLPRPVCVQRGSAPGQHRGRGRVPGRADLGVRRHHHRAVRHCGDHCTRPGPANDRGGGAAAGECTMVWWARTVDAKRCWVATVVPAPVLYVAVLQAPVPPGSLCRVGPPKFVSQTEASGCSGME